MAPVPEIVTLVGLGSGVVYPNPPNFPALASHLELSYELFSCERAAASTAGNHWNAIYLLIAFLAKNAGRLYFFSFKSCPDKNVV